jgi:hypothetical protein
MFTDLLFMFSFWALGLCTGLGLGCALGVQRHLQRERQLELEEA